MENKCICCGKEIPEGRQVCPDCEAKKTLIDKVKDNISFSYGDNPCISIKDSHLITRKADIKAVLEYIRSLDEYQKLKEAGYTRTPASEYQEWKGHNFLYKIGFKKAQTGSVDIDQNEPGWRRFIYAILSLL